jgi:ring-1,2-phenylacetyl-CoA epoxidase subunit PaaD
VVSATQRAWEVLRELPDPELPMLSLCDLGIVRDVHAGDHGIEVVLTPTYSGCPATEVIERSVLDALDAAGLGPASVRLQRAPAWTTDWISDAGRQKMHAHGIAPPRREAGEVTVQVLRRRPTSVECPRCGSTHTEQLAAFGSTACKALHRCLDCREPFDYFKPL